MKRHPIEPFVLLPQIIKWLVLSIPIAFAAGSASALFLFLLDRATEWREIHVWIIAFLPLAGFMIGLVYHVAGKDVEAGNNLLIDEVHDPKKTVPLRMAVLILFSTIVTHLFGGSAGREGTAVQMGGSLADQLTRILKLNNEDRKIILMAGMSAGFASVFGTPLAGGIFGLEVLSIGRLRYNALFPCFLSAILADQVTTAWGIHHTIYSIASVPNLTILHILTMLLAGVIFGLTGMFFSKMTHGISTFFKKFISYAPLRPFVGGLIIALAVFALKTTKYIGLGIPTISSSLETYLPPWDFAVKFIFTVVTLGAGFKGGEVTPLFFIGAALGNALSYILPLPTSLLAGVGLVAVFAGAANTPLACIFMAMEIFGSGIGVYAAIGCIASFLFSGHAGIYHSQRIGLIKILGISKEDDPAEKHSNH